MEKAMLLADVRLGYLITFMWVLLSPYKQHMMGELDVWVLSVIGGIGMLLVEGIEWLNKHTDLSKGFLLMVIYDAIFVTILLISRVCMDDHWFTLTIVLAIVPYSLIISNFRTKMSAWMGTRYKQKTVERLKSRIHRLENRVAMMSILITTLISGTFSDAIIPYIFVVIGTIESFYGWYAYNKYFKVGA